MATARSFPAQDAGRQTSTAGAFRSADRTPADGASATSSNAGKAGGAQAWRVLARIPDVADQESLEASAPISTASTEPAYRFDLPETPHPHDSVKTGVSGHWAAKSGGVRVTRASDGLPGATGLPVWLRPSEVIAGVRPSAAPASGRQERSAAGTAVHFLLLVALFTAAGLSVRLINAPSHPTTTPMKASSPAVDRSAAGSTASVPPAPPVASADTLAKPAAPTPTAAGPLPPSTIAPSTIAVEDLPAEPLADQKSVTVVYPKTLRPTPTQIESMPTDKPATLSPERSPAVAQLPGYILEIPAHQAQHDHAESNVH